jgi:hypothetical protein
MKEIDPLIETLGLLPSVILVVTNIIKNNKEAIDPVVDTVALTLKEFKKDIPEEKIELTDIYGNKVVVTEPKYKLFVSTFITLFTLLYTRLPASQKALFVLSIINLIRNEIPNIKKTAESNIHVDIEKTLIRIIKNSIDIKNKNYRNNTNIINK